MAPVDKINYELAVELACIRYMTYPNFQTLASLMRPEFVRGAINTDNAEFGKFGYCDYYWIQLALVYRGFKPATITSEFIGSGSPIPEWFHKLGLTYTVMPSLFNQHCVVQEYVIHPHLNNVNLDIRTRIESLLIYYRYTQSSSDPSHHSILGYCLGYPPKDIEYFVAKNENRCKVTFSL